MNDQTAQDPQGPGAVPAQPNSYVDEYVPPASNTNLVDVPLDDVAEPMIVEDDDETVDSNVEPSVEADKEEPLSDEDFEDSDDKAVSEEDIESQNIFMMLGVEAGDDDLKEKFLNQLQDVIWDDFLGNDVELLLNEAEITEFKVYKNKVDSTQDEAQEKAKDEMVEFLEKLVPDLEDIMLEKALDLKADLFAERISGMKEYYAEKPEQLAEVNQAETMMFEDKWKTAAITLNDIKE